MVHSIWKSTRELIELRKPWKTSEVTDLIKYRNSLRKTDVIMYRIIKNHITQNCRIGKEKYLDDNEKH